MLSQQEMETVERVIKEGRKRQDLQRDLQRCLDKIREEIISAEEEVTK